MNDRTSPPVTIAHRTDEGRVSAGGGIRRFARGPYGAALALMVGPVAGAAAAAAIGFYAVAAAYFSVGTILALSDLRVRQIPERWSFPGLGALIGAGLVWRGFATTGAACGWTLGIALGFFVLYLLIVRISGNEGLGFGDVVVVAFVSLAVLLVYGEPALALIALCLGSALGVGIEFARGRRANLPYGFWLLLGGGVVIALRTVA